MTPDQPSLGDASTPVVDPKAPPPVESLKVTIQPKKNCKKCHGLGRIGFIEGDENNPLICQCVIKIYKEVQAQMEAKAKEAKAKAALTPLTPTDAPASEPIGPTAIVPGKVADACVNSANDQPKPPDTI